MTLSWVWYCRSESGFNPGTRCHFYLFILRSIYAWHFDGKMQGLKNCVALNIRYIFHIYLWPGSSKVQNICHVWCWSYNEIDSTKSSKFSRSIVTTHQETHEPVQLCRIAHNIKCFSLGLFNTQALDKSFTQQFHQWNGQFSRRHQKLLWIHN